MKKFLFLGQVPLLLLAAALFFASESDRQGGGRTFLPLAVQSWVLGQFTDLKFNLRGKVPQNQPVVIVEIDDASISALGRWPWKRNVTASLIDSVFTFKPKAVGLDIVFSEYEEVFPTELRERMRAKGIDTTAYDHDPVLWSTIANHADQLVVGAFSTHIRPVDLSDSDWKEGGGDQLQPPFETDDKLDLDPFHKFGIGKVSFQNPEQVRRSPLHWAGAWVPNIPEIGMIAKYQGLLDGDLDSDGVIRRSPLVMTSQGRWFSSLGLETYRVWSGKTPTLTLNRSGQVDSIAWMPGNEQTPVNLNGTAQVSFYGSPFKYVRAIDVVCAAGSAACPEELKGRAPASNLDLNSVFKDSAVLVGLTAPGVFDMRTFPLGVNIPGVEGHATLLANLMEQSVLVTPRGMTSIWIFTSILFVLGLLFSIGMNRMSAKKGLVLFLGSFATIVLLDVFLLMGQFKTMLNTGPLYLQWVALFVVTFTAKYMGEEKSKQFVKDAFGKYLSPVLVDSIIADPSKLQLGGEKRELTILFSDIRGFTTFSEKMDPKSLANFLNDYLGIMTDIVFEYQGTLDKYIGDAVMAFWGAPLNQPDHASWAAKASVQMMKRLRKEQPRWKEKYGVEVNIGVGMNSGPVNVGNMGSSKIFEYTVIGDHVNLASRLEGLTKAYGVSVLTTRFTLDSIQGVGESLPPHRVLDWVKVKGKKTAIELIELISTDMTIETLAAFEAGRKLYTEQKWDEAMEQFKKCGEDGPSEVFLERCQEFKQNPPEKEWDGSWEMTSK